MYALTKIDNRSAIEITFDYFKPLYGLDPFHDIVLEYAAETGIPLKAVDPLFSFKFTENGRSIYFYWNGGFTIYVFQIPKARYDIVYGRLRNICARLNKQLGEKHYFAKYGEYPNTF